MKYTSLLPIALISLALTGCTLFPNARTMPIEPPTENPPVAMIDEPTPIVTPTTPEDATKTPTTPVGTVPTKATPPADKDTSKTAVSTEDLTKDLDSFVDDITKGL